MLDELSAEIRENWQNVQSRVADAARIAGRSSNEVKIVAVSKTHPAEVIAAAYHAGIHIFGENYAQELREKAVRLQEDYEDITFGVEDNASEAERENSSPFLFSSLPSEQESDGAPSSIPIQWHFIGHLQSNKCKYVAPFCRFIHSVDSVGLARELSKYALRSGRGFTVLLQVNTSGEFSKSGCHPHDLSALAEAVMPLEGIRIAGLMTIAGLDGTDARGEFAILRNLRSKLAHITGTPETKLELSMGMSGDFAEAIAEGATIVRIGSLVFGRRTTHKMQHL